ncbi:TetR/AcrR family transcriptional regulator [Microbispora hainanensis]|jgi:AcrR family transcriptional regulator|uniref:TetR/AcrR family transcriptional regulator n=1 Tax=Microbispora hainanensis TaxID=568844 RepID=A0ABZ1SW33_9ACTN|nr:MULTISPECIES: TetR family transcriptional regulator [Microbispora]NJP26359.1 TetR family transcriptional regulator [Microbispora sp. CL1-1]TQS12450.1 TetR family transcriptional regulator [Microbispora sp. SCL1-1]
MARSATTTRADILDSAVRLFAAHGFRGTSLQDIATDAGCSKASLLYHFTNKDAILTELLAPVGPEFAALEERIAGLDGEEAARAAVAGLVDLSLRFRLQVKILLQDVDALINRPELPDVDGLTERLADALAGRSAAPQARVWAWMAMLGIILTSASELALPDETLRAELTRGASRTLGLPAD